MARPVKNGLDYFPLDVHIFEDEKIEAIAGEFGVKGELVVIKLLCAVYEKGYFVVWNDLTKAKLLKRVPGASKDLLDQIVNRLVAWEFFHEDLFNSAKVLTSENIQATYFEATKRRKSPKPTKYVINADNNSQVNGVNDNINPQSKGNESKGNENNSMPNDDEAPIRIQSIADFEKLWAFPNFVQQEQILEFVDQYGDDLVTAAIKLAGSKDVIKGKAINFLNSALNEWSDNNVKTVEQAREYQKNRNKRSNGYSKPSGRKETVPDNIINQSNKPDEPVSAEEQAAFEEKLRRIRERKEQNEA